MSAIHITLGSPVYRVLKHIGQCKQPSRYFTTRALPSRLDLTKPSSYVRAISKENLDVASTSQVKQDDFVLYPDFFSPEEQAVLIRLALWKLDRVDTKKKRRRRRKDADDGQDTADSSDLQTLFEDKSMYGFEEVSPSKGCRGYDIVWLTAKELTFSFRYLLGSFRFGHIAL